MAWWMGRRRCRRRFQFGDSRVPALPVEWNGCGETYPAGSRPAAGPRARAATATGSARARPPGTGVSRTGRSKHLLRSRSPRRARGLLDHAAARSRRGERRRPDQDERPGDDRGHHLRQQLRQLRGQPFTHNVDPCRAGASALFLVLRAGARAQVTNSTVTGEGDGLVIGECDSLYSSCNGQERIVLRNNIFIGNTEFLRRTTTLVAGVSGDLSAGPRGVRHRLLGHSSRQGRGLPGRPPHVRRGGRGAANEGIDTFDAHLLATSPAGRRDARRGAFRRLRRPPARRTTRRRSL